MAVQSQPAGTHQDRWVGIENIIVPGWNMGGNSDGVGGGVLCGWGYV